MQGTENAGPETACQPQIWHRPIRGRPSALCANISYILRAKVKKQNKTVSNCFEGWFQTVVMMKKGLCQEMCAETLGIVRTSPNNESVI